MIHSENRCPLFGIMPSLPDAQSITNPHKTVPAVAHRAGRRLNNADHSARAKSRGTGDFLHDEHVARE
jgi:hypothetical protein